MKISRRKRKNPSKKLNAKKTIKQVILEQSKLLKGQERKEKVLFTKELYKYDKNKLELNIIGSAVGILGLLKLRNLWISSVEPITKIPDPDEMPPSKG